MLKTPQRLPPHPCNLFSYLVVLKLTEIHLHYNLRLSYGCLRKLWWTKWPDFDYNLNQPDMATSRTSEINNILNMKARRLFSLFSLSVLSILSTLAQPVWVPTTPSIGTTGPLTIPINYGIDRIGTVYIAYLNYNNPFNL